MSPSDATQPVEDAAQEIQQYDNPPRTSRWRASITSFRDDFMGKEGKEWKGSPWRHTLGIVLLLITVVLWTTSNFLASVSCLLSLSHVKRRLCSVFAEQV
jgi:hypothetical protein